MADMWRDADGSYLTSPKSSFDWQTRNQRFPAFPSLIDQVMLNLIINATHAIEAKKQSDPASMGLITIATRLGNGNDIPEEIMGRFFKTKGAGNGSGKGLTIAHRVIAQHSGDFEVQSQLGEGAIFTITLTADAAVANGAEVSRA